ncbi:hypothetical protein [Orenia marismortui]|uniref:hypothetical protein n=1 Tax=Orenia marismortui TaxID=46469 RepID=UPI00035FB9D2|nr:hypothetical protein [Orenia marismortui]
MAIPKKEERIAEFEVPNIKYSVKTIGRKKAFEESWPRNYKLIAIVLIINVLGIICGQIPFWGIIIGAVLSITSTLIGFKAVNHKTVETIYEIHTKN